MKSTFNTLVLSIGCRLRKHSRRGLLIAALLVGLMLPGLAAAQSVNLNMVSVGINHYRLSKMNLTYSVPDAQQMAWAMNGNRLFAKKQVNILLNEQATVGNIYNALALLERRASSNTYSVLYLSGHGTRDAGGHFLYPAHEYDPARASATSVAGEAIVARMKRMPGCVFLIIDACHSGSAGWSATSRSAPGNQTIIISSSLAREYSLEMSQFQNGAFTQAFLESLGGRADANRNGITTMQEMHNYVYLRVAQITKNKQHMKTYVPTTALGNLALARTSGPAASSVVVWQGRETLKGYGPLAFAFADNRQVTMTDAKGQSTGTWSKQGNVVTLRIGRVVYSGQMSGTNFAGTATNNRTRWNFAVVRR